MSRNCKYDASGEYICPQISKKIKTNLKTNLSETEPITYSDDKWKLHNNRNKWINIFYNNCNNCNDKYLFLK